MDTTRSAGRTARVAEMARDLSDGGGCIGCENCRGICAALVEVLAVPDAVLRREAA